MTPNQPCTHDDPSAPCRCHVTCACRQPGAVCHTKPGGPICPYHRGAIPCPEGAVLPSRAPCYYSTPAGVAAAQRDFEKAAPRQPSAILKWFRWDHLPKPLQEVSAKFGALAHEIDALPGDPAEKATALRYLLLAKDAAVRAAKVD